MNDKTLTAEKLRERLSYTADSGEFHRIKTLNSRHQVGGRVGTRHSKGYWTIGIDGRYYKAHRLAWLFVNGEWPDGEIDHINGNKTDNRIANLRIASRSQNMVNRDAPRCDNKLGMRGVTQIGNRYIARFKNAYLGIFRTAEEAQQTYLTARAGETT